MRPRWEREPGPPPPDLLEAGCLVTATVVAETQRALSESSKESFTLTSPTPVPTAPIQQMILEQDRELARPSPGRIALTRPAEIQNSEMPTDGAYRSTNETRATKNDRHVTVAVLQNADKETPQTVK
eukprot:GHVT01047480.1.p1 GENE.GHVT01047480.1~~GHVT01047480.1.p1  ORF type:complete len:127 (+),score=12.28 GHVT01047480.1:1161-1541(+)